MACVAGAIAVGHDLAQTEGGKSFTSSVSNAVSSGWNWTKKAASDSWDWTKKAASDAWSWTSNAVSDAWNATTDFFRRGIRDHSNTRKQGYEKAKRASDNNDDGSKKEPRGPHKGPFGPHYHPNVDRNDPTYHDHYYFPWRMY